MSKMELCYKDLIVPEEMYENWYEAMYRIAQEEPEEKKILIQLFENEQNKRVKSCLAEILVNLKEKCVLSYLLYIVKTDKDLSIRARTAISLIELEYPHIKNILIELLHHNQIDKIYLAGGLLHLNTSFCRNLLIYLIDIDEVIKNEVIKFHNRILRQKQFYKTKFSSNAEKIYEGITCGALDGTIPYQLSTLAAASKKEREIVFSILEKESNPHQKYLLADALLKVDFERALNQILIVAEDKNYNSFNVVEVLLNLNHPKAIATFKKFRKAYPPSFNLIALTSIHTSQAQQALALLLEEHPELSSEVERLKEINERCKKYYGSPNNN